MINNNSSFQRTFILLSSFINSQELLFYFFLTSAISLNNLSHHSLDGNRFKICYGSGYLAAEEALPCDVFVLLRNKKKTLAMSLSKIAIYFYLFVFLSTKWNLKNFRLHFQTNCLFKAKLNIVYFSTIRFLCLAKRKP